MKKFKYLIIIFAIVGVLAIGVGFIKGASLKGIAQIYYSDDNYLPKEEIKIDSSINDLRFEASYRTISVSVSDKDYSYISYRLVEGSKPLSIRESGNMLSINFPNDPISFPYINYKSAPIEVTRINIHLTSEHLLNRLDLKTKSGTIFNSSNAKFIDVIHSTNSGRIIINGIRATSIEVNTNSGGINLNGVDSNTTNLTSKSGNIIVNSLNSPEQTTINNINGAIKINNIVSKKVGVVNKNGSVVLTNSDVIEIQVKTINGSINVNQDRSKTTYDAESVNGTIIFYGKKVTSIKDISIGKNHYILFSTNGSININNW